MRRKRISLGELAVGVNYSKSIVSNAMNGQKQSRRLVLALAEYLGANPDDFANDEPRAT
ncbi:helix-turn-helix transcriptional regulator [Rhodobacteraceae bacterium SC52]|nr:helix-turn-helix transcriptional regulator [Rhodobacteraceae bacterium SC52]